MPIISTIGRKSFKLRALIILVYLILIAGSATTMYPFLIMLGSSVTSLADFREYSIFPRFIYDDKALEGKYLSEKYRVEQFDIAKLRRHVEEPVVQIVDGETHERRYGGFMEMEKVFKDYDINSPQLKARVTDWLEFAKDLQPKYKDTFFHYRLPLGEAQVRFQDFLKAKYPTIQKLQAALADMTGNYVDIDTPYQAYERHTWRPGDETLTRLWYEFRPSMPAYFCNVMTARPLYQKYLMEQYTKIAALNAELGTSYKFFWEVPFPTTKPAGPEGPRWEAFVRTRMPLFYMRLDVAAAKPSFVAYLKTKFAGVEEYNGKLGKTATSLDDVAPDEYVPLDSLGFDLWQEYVEQKAPLEAMRIDCADTRYADFLAAKYKDASAANAAYGTQFATLADFEPPYREADYYDLKTRKSEIRHFFMTRNYTYVIKKVFLQGRPLLNTFILVTLSVLTAVTINPLAAYALSRYRLRYGAHILIFMLATMAFPAEVAMIPSFLMIKELGMLNSFAALILPGLASGYSIFLLKGFFDSLPAELYEAASIEGASEFRMFWMITMPLSLPILSVIALFSFGGAYGSFMWAFTVCQDTSMWTLMVFLQQFQTGLPSHPYLVMTSLVLAAIPTIIVFLSAQKVLMKGIVVPTMK